MTATLHNPDTATAFSQWIRAQPLLDSKKAGFSITDVDFVIHQFKPFSRNRQRVMLLEEKTNCNDLTKPAQRDTLMLLDYALRAADGSTIPGLYGDRVIEYYGLHVVVLEHTSPLDGAIWWDRQQVDVKGLLRRLQFGFQKPSFI